MSYSIFIGEMVQMTYAADADKPKRKEWWVHEVIHRDAPDFGPADSLSRKRNCRHPAYGAWDTFVRAVGLHGVFYAPRTGLMRRHPGCFRITEKNAEIISDTASFLRDSNPKRTPGWCTCPECRPHESVMKQHDPTLDPNLARLVWLDWWVRWAMKNCKKPGVYNY